MPSSSVEITSANSQIDEAAFLGLPYDLYKGEEMWRAPLRFERKEQFSAKKNPALNSITRQLFLAKRGTKVVGRIAAFVNRAHQKHHNDNAGHFEKRLTCSRFKQTLMQVILVLNRHK